VNGMVNWLKAGGWAVLLGLIFIFLIIWLLGPYISIAGAAPLASVWGRVIATLLVLIVVGLVYGFQWLNKRRAAKNIAAAMGGADKSSNRDSEQIRQRFDEAVALLKSSKSKGRDLYSVPWYIIIGPPGAGKTTILANSGLKFPLSNKYGKSSIRGIGGTRNCDWWFTDQAILLDTAGRFTMQDSDESVDSRGWQSFLEQLKRYRPRQPINGIVLAISLSELLTASAPERLQLATTIQQRFDEIDRTLRLKLPVYVLLTKADLLAGFTEFFGDLNQQQRAQVWGFTLPLLEGDGALAGTALRERIATEYDLLGERITALAMERLESERDLTRRSRIFGFPRQFVTSRSLIVELIDTLFASTDFDSKPLLRGVYFTSGTQEGSPIDRIMGSISRTFGIDLGRGGARGGGGRAYFIESLFKKVIFEESALAGLDRKQEQRTRVTRVGAFAAMTALTVLLTAWMGLSFGHNKTYLQSIAPQVQNLPLAPPGATDVNSVLADKALEWESLRELLKEADPYAGDPPFSNLAGLEQSQAVHHEVREAYLRSLNATLVPLLARHIEARLSDLTGRPEDLYLNLKAYLMMGQPDHLDTDVLRPVLLREAGELAGPDSALAEALSAAVSELLDGDRVALRPVALDNSKIEAARASIRLASPARIAVSMLRFQSAVVEHQHQSQPLSLLVPGVGDLFVRASGKRFDEPLDWLYTLEGFKFASTKGLLAALGNLEKEPWVLGEGFVNPSDVLTIRRKANEYYESDYRIYWRDLLDDLKLKSAGADPRGGLLLTMTRADSPLKGMIRLVAVNTQLIADSSDKDDSALSGSDPISAAAQRAQQAAATATRLTGGLKLGKGTTELFTPFRTLLAGAEGSTPVDQVIKSLSDYQQQSAAMGFGPTDPLAMRRMADVSERIKSTVATWPSPPKEWVASTLSGVQSSAQKQAQQQGAEQVSSGVSGTCQTLVGRRYPFVKSASTEIPLQDFGGLFGGGGQIDGYFQTNLAQFVDQSPAGWHWKAAVTTPPASASQLAMFQRAADIRDAYFPGRSSTLQVTLDLTLVTHSESIQGITIKNGASSNIELPANSRIPKRLQWPGSGAGYASIEMSLGNGVVVPVASAQGDWALFRILDQAQVVPQNERSAEYRYGRDGNQFSILVTSGSLRNPLSRKLFDGFSCGS